MGFFAKFIRAWFAKPFTVAEARRIMVAEVMPLVEEYFASADSTPEEEE